MNPATTRDAPQSSWVIAHITQAESAAAVAWIALHWKKHEVFLLKKKKIKRSPPAAVTLIRTKASHWAEPFFSLWFEHTLYGNVALNDINSISSRHHLLLWFVFPSCTLGVGKKNRYTPILWCLLQQYNISIIIVPVATSHHRHFRIVQKH